MGRIHVELGVGRRWLRLQPSVQRLEHAWCGCVGLGHQGRASSSSVLGYGGNVRSSGLARHALA